MVSVGIMGAGSVGCYLGGRLALNREVDVILVGRKRMASELAEHRLRLQDFGMNEVCVPAQRFSFVQNLSALRGCSVVLCCVKSGHSEEVAKQMAGVLREDAIVVSMQNGVRNAAMLRGNLGNRQVLAAIVDFNVVAKGEGLFQRTTNGPLLVETCEDANWQRVVNAFRAGDLAIEAQSDIQPAQWTKLLVNLNNAISALSDAPTRQLLVDPSYRRVVAAVVAEGVSVLRKAGIHPAKLRGVPVAWMPKVLALPSPIVRLVTRAQMKIDPEARSSMWQDLHARRPTEVDFLNGEIVSLADGLGIDAPLNRAIVTLIRAAESAGQGSPKLSGAALWSALT